MSAEPLNEEELAEWAADPGRDSHHARGRCWATIDSLRQDLVAERAANEILAAELVHRLLRSGTEASADTFRVMVEVATEANYKSYGETRSAFGMPMPPWEEVTEDARALYRKDTAAGLVAVGLPRMVALIARSRIAELGWSCDVNGTTEEPCGECVGCSLNELYEMIGGET